MEKPRAVFNNNVRCALLVVWREICKLAATAPFSGLTFLALKNIMFSLCRACVFCWTAVLGEFAPTYSRLLHHKNRLPMPGQNDVLPPAELGFVGVGLAGAQHSAAVTNRQVELHCVRLCKYSGVCTSPLSTGT